MATFSKCTVHQAGPVSNSSDTPPPVIFISLTDEGGSFRTQWFFAANGIQNQMLAVALAAINGQRFVHVDADPPNPNNTPKTEIKRMYLRLD